MAAHGTQQHNSSIKSSQRILAEIILKSGILLSLLTRQQIVQLISIGSQQHSTKSDCQPNALFEIDVYFIDDPVEYGCENRRGSLESDGDG
jgi:hypothetical protein